VIFLIKSKRYGTVLLILFLALSSYFWLSTTTIHKHKKSAAPSTKKNDSELFLLFSKSPSYHEIYKGIVSKTHSPGKGKAFISYLEALRTNDGESLHQYLPNKLSRGKKDLVSFYQAIDYETLKLGEVIPKEENRTTDIQLFYTVNGVEIGKRLELYYGSNDALMVDETSDLYLGSKKPENLDPVVSAILSQFGNWMDYQPIETAIVDYTSEGTEQNIAFNYPLLLSLRTEKKIDALRYEKPYITIGLEGINLIISKSENIIQAELNGNDRYLLKAGDKEWQALLGYAEGMSNPVDGREVVWNQLSSEQKVRVNGSWEDASVSKLIFHKNMIDSQKGKAYDGKEVVVMSFPTKDNRMPNNMIIYADKETLDYIGEETVD
jgi:hypothetical protein